MRERTTGESAEPTTDVTNAAVTAGQEPPQPDLGNSGFQDAKGLNAPRLLAEDSASDLTDVQMRHAEFLDALHTTICADADEALSSSGLASDGCPWIDYWFSYYATQDALTTERALLKFAPEAAQAQSATDYIAITAARVRASISRWMTTGEISGLPEGVPEEVPGEGSGAPAMFFKAREGGARPSDPRQVQKELGSGSPLSGDVRGRMESALGADLSGVRVHTDARGAALSDGMNARAFTVGKQVAFGAGEYRPGTLAGDALIAHELAHVVQQSGSGKETGGSYNDCEADADRSALGVLSTLWGKGKEVAGAAGPALRSGMRLSRCGKENKKVASKSVTLNITKLEGASYDIDAALTYANDKVYTQADVAVKKGKEITLDEPKSKAILGADLILDEFADPAAPTAEEQKLLRENQTAGAVTSYFVKALSSGSTTAEAFPPYAGVGVGVVVSNEGNEITLSHELGHVLLDSGDHNVPDDTYLMYKDKAPAKYKLTPDQITKIKSSPYVT